MSSLSELPELVGFFSYSRRDDENSDGALSRLRARIQKELHLQLGRDFRLWQDTAAIPDGALWEAEIKRAIAESAFFIPIVTPSAIASRHCRFEFEAFLAREAALERGDLVFPILYIRVPALEREELWRQDDLLKIIGTRQFSDWQKFRHRDVSSPDVAERIERFCSNVLGALHRPWVAPEERRRREEAEAARRAQVEHGREEAGATRRPAMGASEAEAAASRKADDGAHIAGEARGLAAASAEAGERRVQLLQLAPPAARWTPPRATALAGALALALTAAVVLWVKLMPQPPAPPEPVQPEVTPPSPAADMPLSPDRERALRPKDRFRECPTVCPEMVVVPPGSFTMGSPASESGRSDNEGPQHGVTFTNAFAVGRYAVTFDEWDACVADGGCNGYRPDDNGWGRGRRPVINVSWDDAKAYLAWLSRKTGEPYRLPSEAEREYVTRAGTTAPYWWGSTISKSQATYDGTQTMPVDSFAPNPWGVYQVHGNIWEWTEDCWNNSYSAAPGDGSAWKAGDCKSRVVRGGSWVSGPLALRSAYRGWFPADSRSYSPGFRVGRALIPRPVRLTAPG